MRDFHRIFVLLASCLLVSCGGLGNGGSEAGNGILAAGDIASWEYASLVDCGLPGGSVSFYQSDIASGNFNHTLTSFSMGRYEVAYRLWYSVRQWALDEGYAFQNAGSSQGTNAGAPPEEDYALCPVVRISARDAIVWCNAYSEMMGFSPCYYSDSGFETPLRDSRDAAHSGLINAARGSLDYPYVKWGADGFRLPTYGEWLYAASCGGTCGWDRVSGDSGPVEQSNSLGDYAWFKHNSDGRLHDIGTRLANSFGFYDLSGNAMEWVFDYIKFVPGDKTDYCAENPEKDTRALCGGDYTADASTGAGQQFLKIGCPISSQPYYASGSLRVVRRK